MAISSTTNRITYAGNDSTTVFSFPYKFLLDADLVVIVTDAAGAQTTQTITTHYTLSGEGDDAGGDVTMITAPATGETLVIFRDPAATQELDLVENGPAPAEPLEEAYDKLTMLVQRLQELDTRAIKLSEGYKDTFSLILPDVLTADAVIGVDTAGTGLEMKTADDLMTLAGSLLIANNLSDLGSASTARTNLGVDGYDARMTANLDAIAILRTLTGTTAPASDLGTFTGSIITDTTDIKTALQELETALEPITDGLDYQGTWNATTNSPTIVASTGTKGHFYIVSVAGSTSIDGESTWAIGDWILFNGSTWERVINSHAVTSVFTRTGAIVAATNDYTWAQVDKTTSSIADITTKLIDNLSDVDTTTAAPNNTEVLTWDGSNWAPAAASGGSGGGSKNYIGNGTFEADTDTATTAVGVSSSNVGLTILVNSTTPLEAGQDLVLKKTATDMSDEYFTFDSDTVDLIDRGKTMTGSFAWQPSGTYTDGYLVIEAVDQSAGALSVITDFTSNGLPNFTGTVQFRVQTTSSTTEVNLRLVYSDATATAETIGTIDEIKIGPDGVVPGYIGSKSVAFTPSWTNFTLGNGTVDQANWSRSGNFMNLNVHVTLGSTSSMGTGPTIDIPNSHAVDTAVYDVTGFALVGYGTILDNGTVNKALKVNVDSTTALLMRTYNTSAELAGITSTVPMTWTTGDEFQFTAKIPIDGWESTALISTTEALFLTSEITASGNGGEVITASTEAIVFTEVTDTQGLYDGATFTAPKDGMYNVAVGIHITASTSFDLLLYKNGSKEKTIFRATSSTLQAGATNVKLDKDDTISIRTSAGFTLNNTVDCNLVIKEIASMSTFSTYNNEEFVDTVSMVRLHTAAGHGSSSTKIKRFSTEVVNTGSSMTYAGDSSTLGTVITINNSGVYAITYTDTSTAANNSIGFSLNSAQLTTSIGSITTADRLATAFESVADGFALVSWTGSLSQGDVIRPHTIGSANGTTTAAANFTIVRVK